MVLLPVRPVLCCLMALSVGVAPIFAQTETVNHRQVKRHVGQLVTVEGPVAKVRTTADGMQIEIGRAYPSSSLVVLIHTSLLSMFGEIRELEGKVIKVRGTIRRNILEASSTGTGPPRTQPGEPALVKAPSMVLTDRTQLVIVGPAN